ncbi:NifB/NifX family molybdenum-iron cluster-binding protein [Maribellus maritimus]|uniref:NifB/NifX family molybdenum-iron cluster-binding protein n=1 Tax=Maribellus maritimus TaxID=2870838 RepID=UPI001EEA1767|nr:NifB/NifX family molybdenum-iron cluster-binding protein [Maribellus maritimus]MCG6190873.1 hypothetical protein [Maribellus maritimus]
MKRIVFAFALSNENIFINNIFGDADKFAIYQFSDGELVFINEFQNPVPNPGNIDIKEKRERIVSFLKSKDVTVLVSKKFSKNLRLVTDDFIPVLIEKENPEQVVEILNKNMKWIKDELKNRQSGHMLFRINTGVLKLAIK